MRFLIRAAELALLAIFTTIVVGVSTTMTACAGTALFVGGGGRTFGVPPETPSAISSHVDALNAYFLAPSGFCENTCATLPVYKPEQDNWDQTVAGGQANLDNCIRGNSDCVLTPPPYTGTGRQTLSDTSFVVLGSSQGATVATMEKRYLVDNPVKGTTVKFILLANPNRPHGGILESYVGTQFPGALYVVAIGGLDFNALTKILQGGFMTNSGATPTNTGMPTIDVARQYDPIADWPTNPANMLAVTNALMGYRLLHGDYSVGPALMQGQYGDTTYYLIPTPVLPLLMPLEFLPGGTALAVGWDPVLRVLVETAYDRTINPGQPTPADFQYYPDPSQTAARLSLAFRTGIDNFISYTTSDPANRPLGTSVQGPYGVGGPPVNTGCGTPPCGQPSPLSYSSPANATSSEPTVTSTLAEATLAPSIPLTSEPQPDPQQTAVVDSSSSSRTWTALRESAATTAPVINDHVESPNTGASSTSRSTEPTGTLSTSPTPITKDTPTPPAMRKPVQSRPVKASNGPSMASPRSDDEAVESSATATSGSTADGQQ